jgi:hypothetical protein
MWLPQPARQPATNQKLAGILFLNIESAGAAERWQSLGVEQPGFVQSFQLSAYATG